MMNNVDKLSILAGKVVSGGRVSAGKALLNPPVDQSGPKLVAAVTNATGASPVSSVRVTFSEPMNPASFTNADVVSFTGPNGTILVTDIRVVAGSDNKKFDVIFSTQTTPGTYRLVVGPNITDEAGNAMDQNGNGFNGGSQDTSTITFVINPIRTFNATGLPLSLRDLGNTTATLTINEDITIADLSVKLNINHTYDQDLYIHLRGSDGTDVSLVNWRGGSGDNFNNTVFDDEATTAISAAGAPFSGTFRPETSLSVFDGKLAEAPGN